MAVSTPVVPDISIQAANCVCRCGGNHCRNAVSEAIRPAATPMPTIARPTQSMAKESDTANVMQPAAAIDIRTALTRRGP